jgi:chromate reductase, NAD(P)H dehydrogenase (quinone)
MSSPKQVAVIVGSLRQGSLNRKMALAAAAMAPASLQLKIVEIAPLSFFNQDLEAAPPAPWLAFREQIKASDAVLFVTPEYNRSIPGVLKNAIDVASRPYGQSVLANKPGAIIGVVPGAMGSFGAVHHLRQILVSNNMPVMAGPEAYIGGADKLFGADGSISVEASRAFVAKFLGAFEAWVQRFAL